MIIFPYGFYILHGKRPLHLGNDLEAQEAMMTWMDANNSGQLRSDVVGGVQLITKFRGFDDSAWYAAKHEAPRLFEIIVCYGNWMVVKHGQYADYDAALAAHAELLDISRRLH